MTMTTVAVIDYGMGNLHSVSKALEHVAPGAHILVTADPALVKEADRIVLPGVGAIRDCMAEIIRLKVDELVREVAIEKPFLGICVGMQALMTRSEENGGVPCIGLFDEEVRFFGDPLIDQDEFPGERLKVPHMGWNRVSQSHSHPLWFNIEDNSRFYFVHSYYVEPSIPAEVMGTTLYGKRIAAAIGRDNLFAVQFHPEKSQCAGLQLLKNFMRWDGKP